MESIKDTAWGTKNRRLRMDSPGMQDKNRRKLTIKCLLMAFCSMHRPAQPTPAADGSTETHGQTLCRERGRPRMLSPKWVSIESLLSGLRWPFRKGSWRSVKSQRGFGSGGHMENKASKSTGSRHVGTHRVRQRAQDLHGFAPGRVLEPKGEVDTCPICNTEAISNTEPPANEKQAFSTGVYWANS